MKYLLYLGLVCIVSFNAKSEEIVKKTMPIRKNEKAAFTGLLVPEKKFIDLYNSKLLVDELKIKIEIQKKLALNLEEIYKEKLKQASKPLPWYEKPNINRWLGFALGVVFTSLVLYAGTRLMK